MKKFTVIVLGLLIIGQFINFNIQEWETFHNKENGYKGAYIILDEPARKVMEKINLFEIELPGKVLISFNTYDY